MTQAEALLTQVYAAFNARDMEAALSVLHPEVDWPNGWEGGRLHGRDAVRDYWTRQWQAIDPHVEPQRFSLEPDGRTAVDVHQVVRDLDGKLLADAIVQHLYAIRDGQVLSMEIQAATGG